MSGLLPINPADFPDVPTKKALIAIDLQNDFLAEDGALPVGIPDGMIENIIKLAAAVRGSGYGEVVWVRSQFDTNRAAVEDQQIVTAETGQALPSDSTSPEADPESFLSIVSDQPDSEPAKPQCVRKGTRGVELLPAIAAAKGSTDYAMIKSYYSAFQSGQLLHLLRRHFATELYICGALCNVSVYATALEASSYGFDITIVEDCCGYRSESRHLSARKKLTELTGCEYATAADIIPTLRPKSPISKADNSHPPVSAPRIDGTAQKTPSELIAAALAEKRRDSNRGDQGISVRPKSLHSQITTPPPGAQRTRQSVRGDRKPATVPSSLSPDDLSPEMEKLKLNAIESAGPVDVSVAAYEKVQPDPPQSPAEPAIQPVVKASRAKSGEKETQPCANAQEHGPGPAIGRMQPRDMMAAIEATGLESHSTDKTKLTKVQEDASTGTAVDEMVHHLAMLSAEDGPPAGSEMSNLKPDADFNPIEELLTADTPDHIANGEWPVSVKKDSTVSPSPQHSTQKTEDSEGATSKGSMEDASATANSTTSEPLCEGDTTLTQSLLPTFILSGIFKRLCTEVHFLKMMHQGGEVPRFVAVQGSVSPDGTQPVYRHPSDETLLCVPFTPAVQAIREEVEKQVGHEMNHVLIQCYRGGNDYISEHSDKTLDIVEGSYISNVSLGAERTMVFRTKRDASRGEITTPEKESEAAKEKDDQAKDGDKDGEIKTPETPPKSSIRDTPTPSKRQTVRVPLPHNSLLKMGLSTNAKWLHGIRPDKRPLTQRTPDELAFNGYRISLTFRHIGTFLSPPSPPPGTTDKGIDYDDTPLIWGQGATAKTRDGARPVVNGQTEQAIAMLKAFGRENNSSAFARAGSYAGGFNVLHMNSAPRYFTCGDAMIDGRVRVALAELGVKHARGSIGTAKKSAVTVANSSAANHFAVVPVRFEVDDADRTSVTGDAAILLYLDARYPRKKGGDADAARVYTRFYAAVALGHRWKALWAEAEASGGTTTPAAAGERRRGLVRTLLRSDLAAFDAWLAGNTALGHEGGCVFLAGGAEPSIADFAFWPVLRDMAEEWRGAGGGSEGPWVEEIGGKYTALERYYVDFGRRICVVGVFGERAGARDPERREQGDHDDGETESEKGDGRGEDVDKTCNEATETGKEDI